MFSEEDSSGEEVDIYVKLFLFACNAFSKVVKNVNKRGKDEKDCSKKMKKSLSFHQQQNVFQCTEYARNDKIAWKCQ